MQKKRNRGKKFCFRLADLAKAKGISRRSVSKDIKDGKLNPHDIESVCVWLIEPRYRKNKGKPLPWLEGKRGRRKNIS